MVEADHIVTQTPAPNHAQRQAERMRIAVRVEAQRRAREEVKAQIRREGRVKLSEVPAREMPGRRTSQENRPPATSPHSHESGSAQLV